MSNECAVRQKGKDGIYHNCVMGTNHYTIDDYTTHCGLPKHQRMHVDASCWPFHRSGKIFCITSYMSLIWCTNWRSHATTQICKQVQFCYIKMRIDSPAVMKICCLKICTATSTPTLLSRDHDISYSTACLKFQTRSPDIWTEVLENWGIWIWQSLQTIKFPSMSNHNWI